jgi:hypothetical protein
MPLLPSWIVRIHVPIGVSRRHPFAAVRAVLGVIRESERFGRLGVYRDVSELNLGQERFSREGNPQRAHWATVTLTTYAQQASFEELEAFVQRVAKVHPWEHPVIECSGPQGTFTWSPESAIDLENGRNRGAS